MEFIIFNTVQRYVPKEIDEFLVKEPFPYNRTGKVIDFLRNNCFEIDPKKINNSELKNLLVKNPGKYAHYWDKPNSRDIYFYLSKDKKTVLSLNSVDVDVLYRWRIAEYEGREFIVMEEKDPMVLRDINYHDLFRKRLYTDNKDY